jgi:hypothetical protein
MDGSELFLGDGEPGPIPTVPELDALAAELEAVTNELNHARLEGFLREAIENSKPITLSP